MDQERIEQIYDKNDFDNCFEAARKEGIRIAYHSSLNDLDLAGVYQTTDKKSYFIINKLLDLDDQTDVCFMLLARHTTHTHLDYAISLENFMKMKRSRSIFSRSNKLLLFAKISSIANRIFQNKKATL